MKDFKEVTELEKVNFVKIESAVVPSHQARFRKFSMGFTKGFQTAVSAFYTGGTILTIIAGFAAFTVTGLATLLSGGIAILVLGGLGVSLGIYRIWKADKENQAAKDNVLLIKKRVQKELWELAQAYQILESLLQAEQQPIRELENKLKDLKDAEEISAVAQVLKSKYERVKLMEHEQLEVIRKVRALSEYFSKAPVPDKISKLMDGWSFNEPPPASLGIPDKNKAEVEKGYNLLLDKLKPLVIEDENKKKQEDDADKKQKEAYNQKLSLLKTPQLKSNKVVDALTTFSIVFGGITFSAGTALTIGALIVGSAAALFALGAVFTVPFVGALVVGGLGAFLLYKFISTRQSNTKSMLNDATVQLNVVEHELNDVKRDVQESILKNQAAIQHEKTIEEKLVDKQKLQKVNKIAYQNVEQNAATLFREIETLPLNEVQKKIHDVKVNFSNTAGYKYIKDEDTQYYETYKQKLEAIKARFENILVDLKQITVMDDSIILDKKLHQKISDKLTELNMILHGLNESISDIHYVHAKVKRIEEVEKARSKEETTKSPEYKK